MQSRVRAGSGAERVWVDGRVVAVKVKYPSIAKMVRAKVLQLRFPGPVQIAAFPTSSEPPTHARFRMLPPGTDKPVTATRAAVSFEQNDWTGVRVQSRTLMI